MMSEHAWTDRLSDYLDGEQRPEERVELEAHLDECESCRRVLEELRAVAARARALPDVPPARDLWPGIATAIQAPPLSGAAEAGQVIALPTAETRRLAHPARRVSLTHSQLAAAAVSLMVLSVLATWWAGSGLAVRGVPGDRAAPGAVIMAADVPAPPEGLALELRSLEEALAQSSTPLDPNTVRIIEKNLAVIERAIDESRQALAVDPGNTFLVDHLERAYRHKLTYLREAVQLAGWSG